MHFVNCSTSNRFVQTIYEWVFFFLEFDTNKHHVEKMCREGVINAGHCLVYFSEVSGNTKAMLHDDIDANIFFIEVIFNNSRRKYIDIGPSQKDAHIKCLFQSFPRKYMLVEHEICMYIFKNIKFLCT